MCTLGYILFLALTLIITHYSGVAIKYLLSLFLVSKAMLHKCIMNSNIHSLVMCSRATLTRNLAHSVDAVCRVREQFVCCSL